MDIKIILKNHPQIKWVNAFSVVIQCLEDQHLMVLKINMVYAEVKIAWSFANPLDSTQWK